MDQTNNDLTFSSWEWGLGSSHSHSGALLGIRSSSKREVPVVDLEPECKVLPFHRSPPLSSLLSPLSSGFDSLHLTSVFHPDGLERSCASEPLQSNAIDDDEVLSPLDWHTGRRSLLASPFSEDSDSDDGLAPSPFSSPEPSSKPETDEEGCLFFSPSTQQQVSGYHHFCQYPSLELFHDQTDDALSQSLSLSSIIDGHLPFPAPSFTSHGVEEGLQSPSLSAAPLPDFNCCYYFDHTSSVIPESPRSRAVDLPALENENNPKANQFGLGLHSTCPSYSYGNFHPDNDVPPPSGFAQRTTWLSLPGADTDDDLIPAELGSKTYIPDPSITIPTTPPSRSLLIWDPTTRSGLPAGLPSFDGTSHVTHRLDVDALLIGRPHSPEEDFDVDPALLANLAKIDAEKGVEVQKLCDLKQRTNLAAVACRSREGAQFDVERVREKWREVTALLRLKLASDEAGKTGGVVHDARDHAASGGAEDGDGSPPSAPTLGASLLESSASPSFSSRPTSVSSPQFLPVLSSNTSTSDCSVAAFSTSSSIIRRRTSKPKITSMAQLVANMVLHRQQDALRRSPSRGRTWPPVASAAHAATPGKTRSRTQTSPTSPLRQMILPEDLDSNSDSDGNLKCDIQDSDSPLQLSPLCLASCRSPESFYAQLEATTFRPLST